MAPRIKERFVVGILFAACLFYRDLWLLVERETRFITVEEAFILYGAFPGIC